MSNVGGIGGVNGGSADFSANKPSTPESQLPQVPPKKEEESPVEDTMNPIDVVEISKEGQSASDAIQSVLLDPHSNIYRLNPAAAQQVAEEEEKKRKKREEK